MRFVDPPQRDLRSSDSANPAYQVTFWSRSLVRPEIPEEQRPYEAEVWQLADTNVKEVIAWADANVGENRTYQIEVASEDVDAVANLILLFGNNPVSGDGRV